MVSQKKDFVKKSKKTSTVATNPQSVSADAERGDRKRADVKRGERTGHNLAIDMQSDSDFSDSPAIAPRRRSKHRRQIVSSLTSSQSELEDNAGVKPSRATTTKRHRGSDSGSAEVRRKYGSVRTENSLQRRLSTRLRRQKKQPVMLPQPVRSPGSSLRKIKRVRRHRPPETDTHTRAENPTRRSRPPASDARTNLRLRKSVSTHKPSHKSSGAAQKRTILISSGSSDEDGDGDFGAGTGQQIPHSKKRGRGGHDKQFDFPAEIACFSDEDDSPVLQRRRLSSVQTRTRASNASSASKPTQGRCGAGKSTHLTPQAGNHGVTKTPSECQKVPKLSAKPSPLVQRKAMAGRTNGCDVVSRQSQRVGKQNTGLQNDKGRFVQPKVQSTMTQMWNE